MSIAIGLMIGGFAGPPVVPPTATAAATLGLTGAVAATRHRHPRDIYPFTVLYDAALATLTKSGSNITSITDHSGNAHTATVLGTTTEIATDATLNGQKTIQGTSGSSRAGSGVVPPAAGTTPHCDFFVLRVESWVSNTSRICGCGALQLNVRAATTTDQWRLHNSVSSDAVVDIPQNTWGVLRTRFSDAADDWIEFKGTRDAATASPGNSSGTTEWFWMSNATVGNAINGKYRFAGYGEREMTAPEWDEIKAYLDAVVSTGLYS